ncbi:MAG: hypothetical protein R2746_04495 [Acidimicrobiales bacterium]
MSTSNSSLVKLKRNDGLPTQVQLGCERTASCMAIDVSKIFSA